MRITVEIPDAQVKAACRYTGESRKGLAVRKIIVEALEAGREAKKRKREERIKRRSD